MIGGFMDNAGYKALLPYAFYEKNIYYFACKRLEDEIIADHKLLAAFRTLIPVMQWNKDIYKISNDWIYIHKQLIAHRPLSFRNDMERFILGWLRDYVGYYIANETRLNIVFALPQESDLPDIETNIRLAIGTAGFDDSRLYCGSKFWRDYLIYQRIKKLGAVEEAQELGRLYAHAFGSPLREPFEALVEKINTPRFIPGDSFPSTVIGHALYDIAEQIAFDKKYHGG